MELGYSGIAFNRTIKSDNSDSDRFKIAPSDLHSLMAVAPGLVSSAKFHRELLKVSVSCPFRQYNRTTVVVDSVQGAAGLCLGNSALRGFHLVAGRPVNQAAFDHLCKVSEVDIISIDFSQKLSFRPKPLMVKAAIERGIYFEITYSPIISDLHSRRQILTDAKMLVDWTRGKNLIISSGASSVNDVRGPYDVINLASLLGLPVEKAKLAISKNCSRLLTYALRKREYYDGAVRVEKCLPKSKSDSEDWFADWSHWDPISSGVGDLPGLDDISRVFSSLNKASQAQSKTIDELNLNEKSPGRISPTGEESSVKINGLQENYSETIFNPRNRVLCPDVHESASPVTEDAKPNDSQIIPDVHESASPVSEDSKHNAAGIMEIDNICETIELFSDKMHSSNPDEFEVGSVSPSAEKEESHLRTLASANVSETISQEKITEYIPSFCLENVSISTIEETEAGKDKALPNVLVLDPERKFPEFGTVGEVDQLSLSANNISIDVSEEIKVPMVEEDEEQVVEALKTSFVIGHENTKRRKVQCVPPRALFASKHCIRRLFLRRQFARRNHG